MATNPASVTINSGQSASLSLFANGSRPMTVQWFIGTSGNTSNPISGGTSNPITVSPTVTTNYWARVYNSCGAGDTATATVTVH
jgi:hypothetical protein